MRTLECRSHCIMCMRSCMTQDHGHGTVTNDGRHIRAHRLGQPGRWTRMSRYIHNPGTHCKERLSGSIILTTGFKLAYRFGVTTGIKFNYSLKNYLAGLSTTSMFNTGLPHHLTKGAVAQGTQHCMSRLTPPILV